MLELVEGKRVHGMTRYHVVEKGHHPMQIPIEIQQCAVFIGYDHKKSGGARWIGTGFFVSMSAPTTTGSLAAIYLVTARHVLEDARIHSADNTVLVRVNNRDSECQTIEVRADKWINHNDDNMDIAVLPFSDLWLNTMAHGYWEVADAVTKAAIDSIGVGPGDDVFIVGLFTKKVGQKQNIPIVRVGNIAAMPSEPIPITIARMAVKTSAYLIECRSIGGLSGSPVFLHKTRLSSSRFSRHTQQTAEIVMLGMLIAHWDDIDESRDATKASAKVNMGIALAVPIWGIIDLLDCPRLTKERSDMARQFDSKSMPTMDASDAHDAASD